MLDFLSNRFSSIFSRFTGKGILNESAIAETLAQIKEALLEADVPYQIVEEFTTSIKQEVVGQKILASLKPAEQLVKLVYDQLVDFLGGKQPASFMFQLPSVVMIMGLQGSGKTTSVAKMASFVQKEAQKRNKKRKILVGSVDFYRPAAIDQLEQLALQVEVSFYRANATDAIQAAQEIYKEYKKGNFELLFLDTAGRLHIDNHMLQELRDIDVHLNPRYKILVLDAITGQESLNIAQAFEQSVGFYSAMLTKMDSNTRGGAAFAFRYALKKPIVFVGTGEKVSDLSLFHPERIASRMLGMGDIQSLYERANEKIKQSDQESMYKSFATGRITFHDFAKQMDMMNKLGSLTQLMKYMPGMGGMQVSQEDLEQGEFEMKRFRAIINSMSKKERSYPDILNASRKQRIACGAGVRVEDVNSLLKRFEQAQQYAKLFKKSGLLKNMFR